MMYGPGYTPSPSFHAHIAADEARKALIDFPILSSILFQGLTWMADATWMGNPIRSAEAAAEVKKLAERLR
jgi:hypothetical protein